MMCMQLIQQYVQKSRSTTFPLKSARVSSFETLSQEAPPDSSGAGTLFFCADAIGIPPKEKKKSAKTRNITARDENDSEDRIFFIVRIPFYYPFYVLTNISHRISNQRH